MGGPVEGLALGSTSSVCFADTFPWKGKVEEGLRITLAYSP